jgi:hypothetical protein
MPGFTVQRAGFTRTPEMLYAIVQDLLANGFVQKFPSAPLTAPVANTDYAKFKITLEAGPTIDPLAASQPWRMHLSCDQHEQVLDIYMGSPLQLQNDGTVALMDKSDGTTDLSKLPAGMLNTTGIIPQDLTADKPDTYFIHRKARVADKATAANYPLTYRLSITAHGVALAVWEDATDHQDIPRFSWFVAQRPVDHITGSPLVTGHCPMVCLFGMASKCFKFIVRESDVLKPTKPVDAAADVDDSHAIINVKPQVAITENNRYVITFPNGLNTPRYMYTEELDMVAYTSADVVGQYSDVPITVYGEATARTYKALLANAKNNTGMRILFLIKGAGIA